MIFHAAIANADHGAGISLIAIIGVRRYPARPTR